MERTASSTGDRLSEHLFDLLRLIKRELSLEELGVPTWLHLETLRFVGERGDPSMRELADYLRVKAPTATVFVSSLVDDGFIARRADPEDRRRVTLSLTAKGKTCLKDAAKKRDRAFERVVSPLSERDRLEFARILDILTHTS